MLKQILSANDVKKLEVGDQLSDHPEEGLGKTYIILNISKGLVYAVYENGQMELKVFNMHETPETQWWIIPRS